MRKDQTPSDVWTAHRKLRKKIASAKWYAKKKKREIAEENALRLELAEKTKPVERIWPDVQQRWYWQAVLDHHVRGYPVRPDDVPVDVWCHWTNDVEAAIRAVRSTCWGWRVRIPWEDASFLRMVRQLGLRERRRQPTAAAEREGRHNKIPSNNQTINQDKGLASSPGSLPMTCSVEGLLFAGLVWAGRPIDWFPILLRATCHTRMVQLIQHQPPMPHIAPTQAAPPTLSHQPQKPQPHHKEPMSKDDSIAAARLQAVTNHRELEDWLNTYLFPLNNRDECPGVLDFYSKSEWEDDDDEDSQLDRVNELFGTESTGSTDSDSPLWSDALSGIPSPPAPPSPSPAPPPTPPPGIGTPSAL